MTIDELIAATGLTANDEIPIWDAEATGEPTKKITAQQLATAIVALASLVTSVNGETGAVTLTAEDVNAKATQTPVADPTASGNAVAFIDSISQNAQGVIVPTKKTVPNASATAPGLMSAADKVKLDDISVEMLLHMDEINDTVQSIVFDSVGNVSTITHVRNNVMIRKDEFAFGDGTITEVRTLNTGETLTIVTNTTTLVTTVTYAAAA